MHVAIPLTDADGAALARVARRSGVDLEELLVESIRPVLEAAHRVETPDMVDVAAAVPELLA